MLTFVHSFACYVFQPNFSVVQHIHQTENQNVAEKVEPLFTKIKNHRVYLFSAIITQIVTEQYNQTNDKPTVIESAVVSGWELRKNYSSYFKCCFRLKNDTIVSQISSNKSHWVFVGLAKLEAKQFQCPINFDAQDIHSISILSLANDTCPESNQYYILPTMRKHVISHTNETSRLIGVCVKLAYGSLDAHQLIEWFEAHKLFGVHKVIAYTYNLNINASKVLKFYEESGLADVHGFDVPEKGNTYEIKEKYIVG